MSNSSNNTIAKNIIFMYIRMLLIMVVTLFTSRVVLNILGESDFGTYNIVGGVVVMFTFISSAMATGTQRHLSYELGNPNGNIAKIFTACLKIHVVLALIILVFSESIGLWFVNAKMNLPVGRMYIVNWIYQLSILSCMVSIIQVPYTAAIIAHERMSFYAYLSIFDVFMKLGVLYLFMLLPVDKLLLYALLLLCVQIITFFIYIAYCRRHLSNIRLEKITDSSLYKKLLSFSGWSLFGSFANVGYQQGVNVLINLFYGVSLNAAVGIANQVNGAVSQFVSGFQQALNPQLVQSEASKDRERQMDLIFKSSKFSFFIMYIISFPLMINLPYILSLWLGQYPAHTVSICDLILIGVLITCLSGPLWVTIYATGNLKYYQIAVCTVALSVLPINYFGGILGFTPEGMFAVRASNYIFVLAVQLMFLKKYINLNIAFFFKKVLIPVCIVVTVSCGFYYIIHLSLNNADSIVSLSYQTFLYVTICGCTIWFIGLSATEKSQIYILVKSRFL